MSPRPRPGHLAISALCLLGSLAIAPGEARAQSEEEQQATALVGQGLKAARRGRFDDAIAKFEEAHKLFPHPDILHNLARALQKKRDFSEAHARFAEALRMDPDYTYARQARSNMTRIEKILQKTHGRLRVKSTPSQVTVTLRHADGTVESHLVTPVDRWVKPGAVVIEGEKTDFMAAKTDVTVVAGEDVAAEVLLRPIPKKGFLDVTSNVPAAKVIMNGVEIGETPIRGIAYDTGTYALRVEAPGHEPFESQVAIAADQQASVFATMPKLATAKADEKSEGMGNDTLGAIFMGTGGAVLVAGAVMHGLAFVAANDASAVPMGSAFDDEFDSLKGDAEGLQIGAWVGYGVGAALLGTGMYFFLTADDDAPSDGEGAVDVSSPMVIPYAVPTAGGAGVGATVLF